MGRSANIKPSVRKTSRSGVLSMYLQRTPRQDIGISYRHPSHDTWKKLRELTHLKSKRVILCRNKSTGKAHIDRNWRDGLQEMLVESGLATWAEGDSNTLRKTNIRSGENLSWYSFRRTWITFSLKRGVFVETVCNNCYTSIQ